MMNGTIVYLLFFSAELVNCLSNISGDIRIVGTPGGTQTLPSTYIQTFQRWKITKDGNNDDGDSFTLEKMVGSGTGISDANSFVDPTGTTELWWPADISRLQVRPALDVIFRSGTPSYVAGGLDVRVPPQASVDKQEWRNYGLNSQPLARQWTEFSIAVEVGYRVETFLGQVRDVSEGTDASNEDEGIFAEWERFIPKVKQTKQSSEQMQGALENLGVFLSGMDDTSPLRSGFHVLSIPTEHEWTDLPVLGEDEEYKFASIATSLSDVEALLKEHEDVVAMSTSSVLQVVVKKITAGSESEYLPDAYRPLYGSKAK